MWRRLAKGDHSYVATTLNNLAGLYQAQGRLAEAEPLFKDASTCGGGCSRATILTWRPV